MSSTKSTSSVKRVVRVTRKQKGVVKSSDDHRATSFAPTFFVLLGSGFVVLTALLLYLLPDIYAYTHRTHSAPNKVFDNVLSPDISSRLHQACSEWKSDDNVLFTWPLSTPSKRSYIEQVIHQILVEMEGDAPAEPKYYVEYWVRQTWHHTLAHADLDEALLVEEQDKPDSKVPDRHPIFGHVLYLKMGTHVNGPTVVFPNITKGGEMIRPNYDAEMLIVPAIPGRLLRFQGNLLHAVPRPADLWIYPTQKKPIHQPEEEYGRSVLLFNLWPVSEPAPVKNFTNEVEENHHAKSDLCHSREAWQPVSPNDTFEGTLWQRLIASTRTFQLPLMGPERRRGTAELTLKLKANDLVEQALTSLDPSPKRIYLQQKDTDFRSIFRRGGDEL